MYVIHPHKMVYLANVRTGSSTLRRFLTDPANFKAGEIEIVSSGAPGKKHIWGEHHGVDVKVLEQYKDYQCVCVMRNPWDHLVSWWQLHKTKHTFEEFVKDFDNIVFYTLPEEQPHLVQLMLLYCNTMVDFDKFVPYFEAAFNTTLEWAHNSHRTGHYRDFYTPELQEIVANRYSIDIETFYYEF